MASYKRIKKIIRSLLFTLYLLPLSVQAKPLILILDWLVNPDHASIFIAQEKGFFKQEGIQVHIISPSNPDDGPKLVATGHADLAITYQPQLLVQVSQGLPLVRIATLIDKPLNCLIVRSDSPILHIVDLKGKRIGYSSQATGTCMLSTLLEKAGLSLNDVKTVNVSYNLTQALLTHHLDAITNVMRNVEPLELQSVGQAVRIFPIESAGIPTYDELVIVVHRKQLADLRLIPFLIALKKATLYLLKHPEESWRLFAQNHPELNNVLNHRIWKATLPYLARHPTRFNQACYKKFMLFLKQKKIITKTLPYAAYTVQLID